MDGRMVFKPGVPGFPPGASCRATVPQKAPGGSRGTPGRMPAPVPCATGSHRGNASSRTAWMAGWFSNPVSPGFHPGLLVARPIHKKPPAGAGGLRVACLPACHAKQVRTAEMRPVGQHGSRGGFHTRSPRVSTRGFLSRDASTKNPRLGPPATHGRHKTPPIRSARRIHENRYARSSGNGLRFSTPVAVTR
jgi:hypothetical protein